MEEKTRRLSNLGYIYGERVIFKHTLYTPYKHQRGKVSADKGNLYGKSVAEANVDVMVAYAVDAALVEGIKVNEDNWFTGLTRDSYKNGSGVNTIIISDVTAYVPNSVEPEDVGLEEINEEELTEEMVLGPRGTDIPLKKFQELVKHGCCYCTADVLPEDAKELSWYNDQPICYDCIAATYN